MKFKLQLLFLLLISTTQFVTAQVADIKLNYTKGNELLLNDISLGGLIKAEELTRLMGEPSKKVTYKNGETSYFYNEKGMIFSIVDGLVKGAGVNYNWDGDEKFPETTFTGTLMLGELAVNKDTKSADFAGIKEIEFVCPFSLMCASDDKKAHIKCIAGFMDGKLTQVAFLIDYKNE